MNIKPTTKSDVTHHERIITNVFASIPLYRAFSAKTLNTSNPARFFFPGRLVFIITSQLRVLKTNRYIPPIKVR